MKKYFYIYKTNVMSNLQYILNILMGFLSYFIIIFIMLNLWEYIYSDQSNIINGYSINQMIWYIIFTEILWFSIGGNSLCKQVSHDIRTGNIAYNINKPYSYIGYIFSKYMGETTIRIFTYSLVGIISGILLIGGLTSFSLVSIPFFLIVFILGIFINTFIVISIALISFWIEDSNPFHWVYSKLILVAGVIFPIEFFPSFVQGLLNYSPIYVITYGPAKLFVNFSYDLFFNVIFVQVIYLVLVFILCSLVYKKGVKKINVNGG